MPVPNYSKFGPKILKSSDFNEILHSDQVNYAEYNGDTYFDYKVTGVIFWANLVPKFQSYPFSLKFGTVVKLTMLSIMVTLIFTVK